MTQKNNIYDFDKTITARDANLKKYSKPAIVRKSIEKAKINCLGMLMNDFYNDFSLLDPLDPETLKFILNTLFENNLRDQDVAAALRTTRGQIARWKSGAHVPRPDVFREWLVKELLVFTKEKAASLAVRPSRPPAAQQRARTKELKK